MEATRQEVSARFWAKVDKTETCWNWTAATNGRKGYGVFYPPPGRKMYAHRWSYIEANGEIPHSLVVDHLCRNVRCVRPDHLEAVTNRENLMRADVGQRNAARILALPSVSCPDCGQTFRGNGLGPHRVTHRIRAEVNIRCDG